MMKSCKQKTIIAALVCCLICAGSYAQKSVDIKEYLGVWRWVSNHDTLILLIRPAPRTQFTKDFIKLDKYVFGYHSYIKDGELVESDLNLDRDTLSLTASLYGLAQDSLLDFRFNDLTRKMPLEATLDPINGRSDHMWFRAQYNHEMIVDPLDWKRPIPSRMTIPTNIVLERISKLPPIKSTN